MALKKIPPILIITLFLIANSTMLLWFIFYVYYDHLHSDSATLALLAREIVETGQFFPKDWSYVNNDLFIFYKHIFIIPLLAIMPAGFNAFAIASALYAGITLYATWLISSFGNPPLWQRLAVVAISAVGLSGLMLENLYGQGAYGAVFLVSCLLLYTSAQYLSAEKRIMFFSWGTLLAILLLLAFWSNPKRAVVAYGLPLFATILLLTLSATKTQVWRYIALLVWIILGSVAGMLIHQSILLNTNNMTGLTHATWLGLDTILQNQLLFTLQGLYSLLGGLLPAGQPITSIDGIYAGLRFITATLALALLPVAIRKALRGLCTQLKLLALFSAFALGLALLFQVATTVPDVSNPLTSARYLIPSLLLAVFLIILLPIKPTQTPLWSMASVLLLLTFMTSAYDTFSLKYLVMGATLTQLEQTNPARRRLLDALLAHKVEYGYATYWNAGALTVLSDERIKIRHVRFHHGLPIPYRHLSSDRWYRPQAWAGKTFLLLHKDELATIDWAKMKRLGLQPLETFSVADFSVFIFADNIAQTLPFWDNSYTQPTTLLAGVSSQNQVGRLHDINGVTALVAESGEHGALHYGPYAEVKPGRYRVTFDVHAEHDPRGTVRLDVTASPEDKIYAERDLLASHAPQTLEFTLTQPRQLEFRVWTLGNQPVTLRSITLARITEETP